VSAAAAVPPRIDSGLRLLSFAGPAGGDLSAHLRRYGSPPYRNGPLLIIPEVRDAGLTGRGGAAFPVHRKLDAVASAAGETVAVANGAEGEPASDKDKTLLRVAPHLVLDGLQIAAQAVRARTAALYVGASPALLTQLGTAVAERAALGIDRLAVRLIAAPRRFLAGQESALASVVGGGAALPSFTPPRVFERGVNGRPTLVQNVETLAHLALIARYGPGWFRQAGLPDEPGTMLCSVHERYSARVTEVPIGTPIADLVSLTCTQAVLIGGYHGAWLPAGQLTGLTLSNTALRPLGGSLGAGVVAALPAGRCGLAETARLVRYLALESAGQCGPCLNGLPRIAAAMTRLAAARAAATTLTDLRRWAGLTDKRGACQHPDGTVRLVRSALRTFAGELRLHDRGACSDTGAGPFLPVTAGPADQEDWS